MSSAFYSSGASNLRVVKGGARNSGCSRGNRHENFLNDCPGCDSGFMLRTWTCSVAQRNDRHGLCHCQCARSIFKEHLQCDRCEEPGGILVHRPWSMMFGCIISKKCFQEWLLQFVVVSATDAPVVVF